MYVMCNVHGETARAIDLCTRDKRLECVRNFHTLLGGIHGASLPGLLGGQWHHLRRGALISWEASHI